MGRIYVPKPYLNPTIGTPSAKVRKGRMIAFSPADLSSLYAWFKSDSGVTDAGAGSVANWADLSGNGNDAQGGVSNPTLTPNQLNGYPSIVFSGAHILMISGAAGFSQPFVFFWVISNVDLVSSVNHLFITDWVRGWDYCAIVASDLLEDAGAALTGGTLVHGQNFFATFVLNGANSKIYLNGVVAASGNAGAGGGGVHLYIGNDGLGLAFLWAGVVELIICAKLPTDYELGCVHNYIRDRYAFP